MHSRRALPDGSDPGGAWAIATGTVCCGADGGDEWHRGSVGCRGRRPWRRWTRDEFGAEKLGDRQLTARLSVGEALLADYPGRAPGSPARGDPGSGDGSYRLIEEPRKMAAKSRAILASLRERTIQRMGSQGTVLCIQRGIDVSFRTRSGSDGPELIGGDERGGKPLGLHLQVTLALSEKGMPPGLLRCAFGKPAKDQRGSSRQWIDAYRDILKAAGQPTQRTRVVAVTDRYKDFFGLFDKYRREARVKILAPARHSRWLERQDKELLATLSGGPADGSIDVETESLAQERRRLAACELRYRCARLPAKERQGKPLDLAGVHVAETARPEGEKRVEWHLVTSQEVGDAEAAARVASHYLLRQRVEDYEQVLQWDSRAEHLAYRTTNLFPRAVAINSVMAWSIMLMTLLGREVPEREARLAFSDHELAFLTDHAAEFREARPAGLGTAVRLMAHLGGLRCPGKSPDSGRQAMWHGYRRLTGATLGHRVAVEAVRRRNLEGRP